MADSSKTTKIVIIVLVLIAVLFAVTMWFGATNNGSKSKADNRKQADNYSPNGFIKGLGSVFDSFKPRVKLSDTDLPSKIISLGGSGGGGKGSSSITIQIKPGKSDNRAGTIIYRSGSGQLKYFDAGNTEDLRKEQEKDTDFPKDFRGSPRKTSIIASKVGGQLVITCKDPCQLEFSE